MILSPQFDRALVFASGLHRAQSRKGTSIPYISHLLAVCGLVIEHGGTEDQAIAALLHDAAEDQGGEAMLAVIRREFGDAVADIVRDCTDTVEDPKPPFRPRKEAYLAGLPKKPKSSLLVSLADKTHNASAIACDYGVLGEKLWDRFNGGREGTIWYYRALSSIFDETMPGPLARQLSGWVGQFAPEAAR